MSFVFSYYLRYKNQNLPLNKFEDKTGNIISMVFFGMIFLCLIVMLIAPERTGTSNSFFLLVLSIASLIALLATGYITQKETKIIFAGIFLVISLYILTTLFGKMVSGNRFGFIRGIFFFLIMLVLLIFTVFLYVLNYSDDYDLYANTGKTANSAVILGAAVWGGNRPSPVLKERINKGFEIYQKKIVPKIVITGGGSPNEMTEGEVSKQVLIKYGVDPANLILENSSSSTIEQVHFVRDSLYETNNWNKIILISDNFHLRRASQISKFNNMNVDCIASGKELSTEGSFSFCLKESFALIIFWMLGI